MQMDSTMWVQWQDTHLAYLQVDSLNPPKWEETGRAIQIPAPRTSAHQVVDPFQNQWFSSSSIQ